MLAERHGLEVLGAEAVDIGEERLVVAALLLQSLELLTVEFLEIRRRDGLVRSDGPP